MNDPRSSAPAADATASSATLQFQRDQALAGLVLALTISAAGFISAYGPRGRDLEPVLEAVEVHWALLKNAEAHLQQNQYELRDVRAALELARRAPP